VTERETILIADDNESVTAALSILLDRPGRTTIICADVESAELMLAREPVTHVVTDVQFSGAFGFEGLHFLDRIRTRRPGCRIVLMTGQPSDALHAAAIEHGALALLSKPFTIDELESALGTHRPGGRLENLPYTVIRVASFDELVAGDALRIAFQPIVEITDAGAIMAFEALTRVRGEWAGGGPAELFDYAARLGRLRELNLLSLARAIEAAASLPLESSIFLNVDPVSFCAELPRVIEGAAARAGIELTRIVLEVTERSDFDDRQRVIPLFHALRASGIRFALDDHGSAYSHLDLIDDIRPSFIKISNTFGTKLEDDDTHRRIVAHMASLSHEFGCKTVLEGIESAETARTAERLGIDFAQGFHFGRPDFASHWIAALKEIA
jgi:EAL domain-containing protein (putative c-di-GMP-specific phosphodiesterase class I)